MLKLEGPACTPFTQQQEKMDRKALLKHVTWEINEILRTEHEDFLKLTSFRPLQFLAGCMCWEFQIDENVLENSFRNLAPCNEELVRFPWLPDVFPDAGTLLARLANLGGSRGILRAQIQLIALQWHVPGNFMWAVLLLLIASVLLPVLTVTSIVSQILMFRVEELWELLSWPTLCLLMFVPWLASSASFRIFVTRAEN